MNNNKISAIILCAGKSTRLKNYYKKTKILIPLLKNKSSLDFNIDLIKNLNLNKLYININNNNFEIKDYLKKYNFNNLTFSLEKKILGTCGAVRKIKKKIYENTLIVIYGDTICKIKMKKLINFHYSNKSNFTMVSNRLNDYKNSGVLKINKKNNLIDFHEKNKEKKIKSKWVNSGIYLINKNILEKIKNNHFDFSYDFIPYLINQKEKIFVYKSEGNFYTIDTKKLLENTRKKLRAKLK